MPWGAAIAAVGSIAGGLISKSSSSDASKQALTGYNYLSGDQANQAAQTAGTAAATAGQTTQGAEAQLLGTQPITNQTQNGFNNYLNSTGYNFQLNQGTDALTGSAAARGILNSGSTAKALTSYGQNLASTTFNNYLGNLSGLNTQQQNTANTGVNAAENVGAAGNTGGGNASSATQAGGAALGNGVTSAAGVMGQAAPSMLNYFGGM